MQCLISPVGSCAPGSQPDGFRNRVAAVSALGQPHLYWPALGSPTAPRSEPGNPTLEGTEWKPLSPSVAGPRCRSGANMTMPHMCRGAHTGVQGYRTQKNRMHTAFRISRSRFQVCGRHNIVPACSTCWPC
nr:CDC42 small effector protein 1 isoform X1 [Manis javanica]